MLIYLTSNSGFLDIAFIRISFSRVYKKTHGIFTLSSPSPLIANIGCSSAFEYGTLSTTCVRNIHEIQLNVLK